MQSNLINHVTFSLDRYINRGGEQDGGPGLGDDSWASRAFPTMTARSRPSTSAAASPLPPTSIARTTRTGSDFGWGVSQSLTWSVGSHTMKFGGEIGRNRASIASSAADAPARSTSATSRRASRTRRSFGLGQRVCQLPPRRRVVGDAPSFPWSTRLKLRRYALFAQDEWRATLESDPLVRSALGLPAALPGGRQPDQHVPARPRQPRRGGPAGRARLRRRPMSTSTATASRTSWLSGFGPRLGIGYMLTPKTNLRASWGLYYGGTGNQNALTPDRLPGQPDVPVAQQLTRRSSTGRRSRSRSRSTVRRHSTRRSRTARR